MEEALICVVIHTGHILFQWAQWKWIFRILHIIGYQKCVGCVRSCASELIVPVLMDIIYCEIIITQNRQNKQQQ